MFQKLRMSETQTTVLSDALPHKHQLKGNSGVTSKITLNKENLPYNTRNNIKKPSQQTKNKPFGVQNKTRKPLSTIDAALNIITVLGSDSLPSSETSIPVVELQEELSTKKVLFLNITYHYIKLPF